MSQNNHQHRPLMVQAPVRALDPDGVAVVTTGTVGFAIGAALCWYLLPQLTAVGKQWYLWVAITGTVIGLLGLAFGLSRKVRRRRAGDSGDEPTPSGDLPELPDAAGRRAAPTPTSEDESAKA